MIIILNLNCKSIIIWEIAMIWMKFENLLKDKWKIWIFFISSKKISKNIHLRILTQFSYTISNIILFILYYILIFILHIYLHMLYIYTMFSLWNNLYNKFNLLSLLLGIINKKNDKTHLPCHNWSTIEWHCDISKALLIQNHQLSFELLAILNASHRVARTLQVTWNKIRKKC